MRKDEILEYPYVGTITRVIEGVGRKADTEEVLYDGEMDLHTQTDEEGHTLQTSSYIVSIPLTQDEFGSWVVPCKGDKISVERYGQVITLTCDNAEPSQLGGVSIYASRSDW